MIKKLIPHFHVVLLLTIGFVLIQSRQWFGASLFLEIAIFTSALIALIKAADNFTDLAVQVGEGLGLSKLAIGTLIVAIGTSAPELFSSINAVLLGETGMAIGNIYGTVVANTLLGIGAAALFSPVALPVHKDVFGTKMSVFLGSVLLSTGMLYDGVLSPFDGSILLIVLAAYLYTMLKNKRQQPEEGQESDPIIEKPSLFSLFFLILNLAFLFVAGDYVVQSLIAGADLTGIVSAKLSSTLLAVGTSVPEIAIAITIVRRKTGSNNDKADLLLGEILGSNIFGIFGILGAITFISPLTMDSNLLLYLSIAIIAMFFITNVVMNDRKIERLEGVVLIFLFWVFSWQLMQL